MRCSRAPRRPRRPSRLPRRRLQPRAALAPGDYPARLPAGRWRSAPRPRRAQDPPDEESRCHRRGEGARDEGTDGGREARGERAAEAADAARYAAHVARSRLVYVPVVADVDGHVARAVEDVAGLRLRERYSPELLVLGPRVVAYADARLRVAVLREPAAVERLAGGRASPDVGHAELAVRRLDDRVPVRGRVLQVLDRHGVEPVEAPLRHDRLQGFDVGRVGRPAAVLEPLGHPVRVVPLDRLADEGVA